MKLANYLGGRWMEGQGEGIALTDPVSNTVLAQASALGMDYRAALIHARGTGGPALRDLTFEERARQLERIAQVLTANRAAYYEIALQNSGSSKADAAIDIEGALFTLKYYARIGAALGQSRCLRDADVAALSKDGSFATLHVGTALRGAAILINAFNFPAWGLWEKAASALLCGVPVLAKPATATAWLAQKMVADVVDAGVLPEGALSIVCGQIGDLLDHVGESDAISFTGSAETAQKVRSHAAITRRSARVNIEADSLNVAILGADATSDAPIVALFVQEVIREMTLKAGQRCTAIRRVLVPAPLLDRVADALRARLAKIVVGDPRNPDVQMGPVVNLEQRQNVEAGIRRLATQCSLVIGTVESERLQGSDAAQGAFVMPTLFRNDSPFDAPLVHELEVFGPVATLMPYRETDDALQLAALGRGSLVASVFSDDTQLIERAALELASHHGRVHVVSSEVSSVQTGHGNVMPMSVHGGPGRAGGGQELGGLRALRFYHQFSAVQGPRLSLQRLAERAALLSN